MMSAGVLYLLRHGLGKSNRVELDWIEVDWKRYCPICPGGLVRSSSFVIPFFCIPVSNHTLLFGT